MLRRFRYSANQNSLRGKFDAPTNVKQNNFEHSLLKTASAPATSKSGKTKWLEIKRQLSKMQFPCRQPKWERMLFHIRSILTNWKARHTLELMLFVLNRPK